MIKKLVALLMIGSIFCSEDSSPCDDFVYNRLKRLDINAMSNSEYSYFIEMDKKCKAFKSNEKIEDKSKVDKESKNNKKFLDFFKEDSPSSNDLPPSKGSSDSKVKSGLDSKLDKKEDPPIVDYVIDQNSNYRQSNGYIRNFNARYYGESDAEKMFDKSMWQYGGGMLSSTISSTSFLLFMAAFSENLEGPFIPIIFYLGTSLFTPRIVSGMIKVRYPTDQFLSSYPKDEIALYRDVYKERTLELRSRAMMTGHLQIVVYSFLFGMFLGFALD